MHSHMISIAHVLHPCTYVAMHVINNLLPEGICCCLQICNVAASEEIVGERCVPSLIVISTAINQLETKVSIKQFIA